MTFILRAHNIWKSVDGRLVLRGVTIRVKPGMLCFVVGPRGSGKAVLARILAGLEEPDKGTVYVGDLPIRYREARARVSFYPPPVSPHHSVLDALLNTARRLGMHPSDARDRVNRLIGWFGLGDVLPAFLYSLPRNLLVRVFLAITLFSKPAAAVIYEPFRDIDAAESLFIIRRLREIARSEGTGFVILTSNPVIADTGDYIYVMKDGAVVDEGWREELIERIIGDPVKIELVVEGGAESLGDYNTISVKRLGERRIIKVSLEELSELPGLVARIIEAGGKPVLIRVDKPRISDVVDILLSK